MVHPCDFHVLLYFSYGVDRFFKKLACSVWFVSVSICRLCVFLMFPILFLWFFVFHLSVFLFCSLWTTSYLPQVAAKLPRATANLCLSYKTAKKTETMKNYNISWTTNEKTTNECVKNKENIIISLLKTWTTTYLPQVVANLACRGVWQVRFSLFFICFQLFFICVSWFT